jgi:hypothetical protein
MSPSLPNKPFRICPSEYALVQEVFPSVELTKKLAANRYRAGWAVVEVVNGP